MLHPTTVREMKWPGLRDLLRCENLQLMLLHSIRQFISGSVVYSIHLLVSYSVPSSLSTVIKAASTLIGQSQVSHSSSGLSKLNANNSHLAIARRTHPSLW